MANCNTNFKNYNNAIKLSDEKRDVLLKVRTTLRDRMNNTYQLFEAKERANHLLEFQSQGSFVMDTIITPEQEDFDLDDGVYFIGDLDEKKRPETKVFHELIIKAIDKDNEYEEIIDKVTCVRVQYKKGFHIDLPIYYACNMEHPELAHKKQGWVVSNPVEFIAWFEEKANSSFQKSFLYENKLYSVQYEKWLTDVRKKDCQLRRIVRYLKAWADLKRKEMPCGIEMTILTANNFAENEREDIALRDTLINIKNYLANNGFKCPRPTVPVGQDLFENKTLAEKEYFLNALNALISSANKAIASNSEYESCEEWKKHFGKRFKCNENNTNGNEPKRDLSALYGLASQNKPYGF
jgi:hypothetical protein